MPRVSVIMPVYKVEKFIAKSIRSVLSQTLADFELLVVSDESPDRSCEIAASFKDKRIKIYKKKHGGLSDTRNYGLERATGKYIYFIDPDDWIEPDLLTENISIIEKEKLDFVVFGYFEEFENTRGEIKRKTLINSKVAAFVKGDKNLNIDGYHLGMMGYAWNKVYRREFLDKHQFRFAKGISLIEDILFNTSIFAAARIIRFNPECYYHYVNRKRESLINRFHEDSFGLIKRKTEALKYFSRQWGLPCEKELLSSSIVSGINYCIYNIYVCKNTLTQEEKRKLVDEIVSDAKTVNLISHYPAVTSRDKLYKKSIQNRWVDMVTRMALHHE